LKSQSDHAAWLGLHRSGLSQRAWIDSVPNQGKNAPRPLWQEFGKRETADLPDQRTASEIQITAIESIIASDTILTWVLASALAIVDCMIASSALDGDGKAGGNHNSSHDNQEIRAVEDHSLV
jgi:hypothetical protein